MLNNGTAQSGGGVGLTFHMETPGNLGVTSTGRWCGIAGVNTSTTAYANTNALVFYTGLNPSGAAPSGGATMYTQNVSERMRIDRDGNVGIGEMGPQEKLDVVGNIRVKGSSTPKLIIENTDTGLSEDQEIGAIQFKINDNSSSGSCLALE